MSNNIMHPHPPIPPRPPRPPMPFPPAPIPGPGCFPMTPVYIDASLCLPGAAAEASSVGQLLDQKVDIESIEGKSITLTDGMLEIAGFMDAEEGKVPSKTADGIKWIEVEGSGGGGEVKIETILVNGVALVPDDHKAVEIDIPTALSDLTNDSRFVTQEGIDSALESKQDKLVSGMNVKTINGQSVLGSGNIEISGGDPQITTKVEELESDIDGLNTQVQDISNLIPSSAAVSNKLATEEDLDKNVCVAIFNSTSAQSILNHINTTSEPFAPLIVKRGTDYYTVLTAVKTSNNSVTLRTIGSNSGEWYIFDYIVTNESWSSHSYGLQNKLVSGNNIKTINGQSILGSGNIVLTDVSDIVSQLEAAVSDLQVRVEALENP